MKKQTHAVNSRSAKKIAPPRAKVEIRQMPSGVRSIAEIQS